MKTLHLGVVDIPYVAAETPAQQRKRVKKRPHPPAGAKTTGDVAEILEAKYHVMEAFYEIHGQEIGDGLAEAMAGSMETVLLGGPIPSDPIAAGTSQIKHMFDMFITNKEMDALGYPGVPTKASLMGVSHRFKKRKGGPRPSFVDTGLYLTSFEAWAD